MIGRKEQTDADFRRARELVIGTGALDATLDLAGRLRRRRQARAGLFPAGEWREALESLADFAVSRRA